MKLETRERAALAARISTIRARESLVFISDVKSMLGGPDDSRAYQEELSYAAFWDEPKILAEVLMKLSAG